MKNKFSVRKSLATVLITVMLFNITGCSDFLKKIATQKVEDYVVTAINGFFEHPVDVITSNSKEEVIIPELTEQQEQMALNVIAGSAYEISKIKINDKRDKAVVTLNFENCAYFEEEFPIGKVDELEDMLVYHDVDIDLTVLRTEDHQWIFEDLNKLSEIFFNPFESPCILDEDGNPYNINEAYINLVYVDNYWFDPLMDNPIAGSSLRNTDYLKCVIYFNRPMNITCTAELLCNGDVVATYEVNIDGHVTADCHFTAESGNFSAGTYSVVLSYNGQELVTSSSLTVS